MRQQKKYMWNKLTVTTRVQVFQSEINIPSVTGRKSPRYAETLNYTPFEGNDRT